MACDNIDLSGVLTDPGDGLGFNILTSPTNGIQNGAFDGDALGDDGLAGNTLTLSSGDVIIPGLFFDASAIVFGSQGIADLQIRTIWVSRSSRYAAMNSIRTLRIGRTDR